MAYLYDLFTNTYILVFIALLIPILLSLRMYPVIIYLVKSKNLMDEPVDRSIHTTKTPTLGGVGMFITFSLTLIIAGMLLDLSQANLLKLLSLLAATITLMFLGIKDDLLGLAPKKKFLIQILAATLVIVFTDVRIVSCHGLLGLEELPYLVSVFFSIFVFLAVINAYNMIDGINGLAGTIGIVVSATFGVFYLLNGRYLMIAVSFALIGALIGFLRFNLWERRRIFMGDSGSMFIGFILAYQAISFLEFNATTVTPYTIPVAPIMAMAILSFPILDTVRVFIIRIAQKRSPFSADRNHIHHRLLDLGLSHRKATLTLAIINILVIVLAFVIKDLYINLQLYILILAVPLLYFSPWLVKRKEGNIKLRIPKKSRWAKLRTLINNFLG
ncbi:MraY family glycosyltransferase [Arenibacter echinorum]|uniref:UDP-N-acetylmuramyl pentapeptide phosphotransferase/UDP-N-acetylglucosamine-1-phosphate transferase n=1 Tax=Arenibacter echinorum TaxID=440515 RepID=A0A327QRX7_9FLAO|nr:MraY family glycosyltransferase [Arenibacter echinorum]RAJ07120.1 UDP-N-acetylmuramyl pentapeptide phosphotransferase/UDP-N-acetylglucosamine-1-phosphate transferase [Arenibacter echinorum]